MMMMMLMKMVIMIVIMMMMMALMMMVIVSRTFPFLVSTTSSFSSLCFIWSQNIIRWDFPIIHFGYPPPQSKLDKTL